MISYVRVKKKSTQKLGIEPGTFWLHDSKDMYLTTRLFYPIQKNYFLNIIWLIFFLLTNVFFEICCVSIFTHWFLVLARNPLHVYKGQCLRPHCSFSQWKATSKERYCKLCSNFYFYPYKVFALIHTHGLNSHLKKINYFLEGFKLIMLCWYGDVTPILSIVITLYIYDTH